MAITFNGSTKTISLTAGTTELGVRELWSEWVTWLAISDNSKFLRAMDVVGGNDIDAIAGTKIPIYLFMQNGWKIKPQELDHTLNVIDGILLVDGGGDPFINTIGDYVVRINYQQPVQAISFSTSGGGGLTSDQDNKLTDIYNKMIEIHKLQGLNASYPMTVSNTQRIVDNIQLTIEENNGEVTVTRQ